MNLDKFTKEMDIIAKLADSPSETAEELKAKFDEGGKALQAFINSMIENLHNAIWPIGSIYLSVNAANPAELFGGVWEKIENAFLYGVSSDRLEETGGSATHILTEDEMPSHWHEDLALLNGNTVRIKLYPSNVGDGSGWHVLANSAPKDSRDYEAGDLYTASRGGGKEHNNMPPYLAVSIWKRVG